jgi:hypothetical protein
MRAITKVRDRRLPSTRLAPTIAMIALLGAAMVAPTTFAAATTPVLGSAVVDGDPGEWTDADYFADMTDNGNPLNEVLATISLRYDCDTGTLYALVMVTSGNEGLVKQDRPDEGYIRIDGVTVVRASNGDDGSPPDFVWVNGNGTRADGYEASANVAPGSYTVRAHFLFEFDDEDGYLTIDTVPREAPLTIACPQPTPEATPAPTPEVTPASTPETTPAATPEATPEVTPEATPGATPEATPAPTPEATPTEEVGPAEGTPTPTPPQGNVGGATGRPNTTLPPTDTIPATVAHPASQNLQIVLLLLGLLTGTLLLVTPAHPRRIQSRTGPE